MRVPISCGVKGMSWMLEKMDKMKDEETSVRLALRVNRTSSTRILPGCTVPTKQETSGCAHNLLYFGRYITSLWRRQFPPPYRPHYLMEFAEQIHLLPRSVRLTAVKQEVRLSLSKIQDHLAEVAIGPCEP